MRVLALFVVGVCGVGAVMAQTSPAATSADVDNVRVMLVSLGVAVAYALGFIGGNQG